MPLRTSMWLMLTVDLRFIGIPGSSVVKHEPSLRDPPAPAGGTESTDRPGKTPHNLHDLDLVTSDLLDPDLVR